MPDPLQVVGGYALNLPAMQNPGLVDWRLSPGSFAATPQVLVGEDGSESFLPGVFATSTFHLRQVVRQADVERLGGTQARSGYVTGEVLEFSVSIIPVGHSLGQVLYSLPLAPGESVRLAVVDWRRSDLGDRRESTQVTEELMHEQTRDRTVTELMQATLREWQRGGSIMGGIAAGAGGSASMGIPLLSAGIAGGAMASVGGGYSTSSGTRDLVGETAQRVTDAVSQVSAMMREQRTSAVVQTDATEREAIETRAFVNFNRGHSLTVLYYEVLRHFRIVTEFTRRLRVVLLPRKVWSLSDTQLLLSKRYTLEPALLDPALAPAFDAMVRYDTLRHDLARKPATIASPAESDIAFTQIVSRFHVGNEQTTNGVYLAMVVNSVPQDLTYGNSTNLNRDKQFNHNTEGGQPITIVSLLPAPVKWSQIGSFVLRKSTDGSIDLRVTFVEVVGMYAGGQRTLHTHIPGSTYFFEDDDAGNYVLAVTAPPPAAPTASAPTADSLAAAEDLAVIQRLKDHLELEKSYYTRVLDMSTHPDSYAVALEKTPWGDAGAAIDAVSPTPLEVLGSFTAFPLLNQTFNDEPPQVAPVESLIALPTRGVFAEAKLGHANVAEQIDETRFWRWDEHPLPFTASDIAPVDPVRPQSAQLPLQPTPMGPPTIGIQAPPSEPDPTGLAAVLKALTTPDVFRDMSGRQEVQKLLEDLIEGSVSMADAANKAKEIQQQMQLETDRVTREKNLGLARVATELERSRVQDRLAQQQQTSPEDATHAIKVVDNQVREGKVTKDEGNQIIKAQLSNMKGSKTPPPPKQQLNFIFNYSP